jgi:DNA-directed RNA polymerase specialized sigma24 family protein
MLVDRCLAGDVTAWSSLYRQFHDSLMTAIRAFLGRSGHDANLVEEIAARVWYALVKNDFELLAKFTPQRGCRLSTFLSAVARNEARLLLRSERCRKTREQVASKQETQSASRSGAAAWPSDEEFLIMLSPAERTFYLDVLLARHGNGKAAAYTQQNQWQLRHRIRKKLERFISQAS